MASFGGHLDTVSADDVLLLRFALTCEPLAAVDDTLGPRASSVATGASFIIVRVSNIPFES
jgi:hypothetical protein